MTSSEIAIAVRPRAPYEAVDLGFRFARTLFRPLFAAHALVVAAVAFALLEAGPWLQRKLGKGDRDTQVETVEQVDSEPRQVTLTIESTPAGAAVIRQSDGVTLGVTPYTTTVPASERALVFTLALDGHEDASVVIPADESGTRRVLLTAEQRLYSDLYILRLIRIGGAVFYDVGRAWGEPYQNFPDPHWSANAGFGLRLLSARSATGTTLHLDIAFPLRREPGLDSYQLTMESKSSF